MKILRLFFHVVSPLTPKTLTPIATTTTYLFCAWDQVEASASFHMNNSLSLWYGRFRVYRAFAPKLAYPDFQPAFADISKHSLWEITLSKCVTNCLIIHVFILLKRVNLWRTNTNYRTCTETINKRSQTILARYYSILIQDWLKFIRHTYTLKLIVKRSLTEYW